jgi:hypothetical protein
MCCIIENSKEKIYFGVGEKAALLMKKKGFKVISLADSWVLSAPPESGG